MVDGSSTLPVVVALEITVYDSPQCFSHELLTVLQKTLLMYNKSILVTQDQG